MEVCTIWMQKYVPKHTENNATPIPDFSLKQAKINWGGVATTALKIQCAEKDSLYLKSLMSHAWKKMSTLHRKIIPAQARILTSPETYCNLLHNQKQYINDVTSITIEGLHPEVANKEIEVS
eukprot:7649551-Ditylum_brightwellii.AAC.1